MRPWHEIPTALSSIETKALQSFVHGRRVAECGALLGYSTLAMADVAASVISIDKHEGYGPSTLTSFMSNVEGKLDRIAPIIADARKVISHINCDRYFLDLDGQYTTTMDVLTKIPMNNAMIAIHDFNRNSCSGVGKAILDAGLRIDHVVDTLCFARKL